MDVRIGVTYSPKELDVEVPEGTSAEEVREQAERTGMPADEITLVADTVVVRPDPAPATA